MDLTSLNISLPKTLKDYVEGQVADGTYSTPSEYMRELIRNDQKRRAHERLEAALLEGLNSGPPVEANEQYWAHKGRAIQERHEPTKAAR